MRVLFVDDDLNVLEGLERMLFHLDDWEICTAASGHEALDMLRQSREAPFDAVVTDMRMPGMDGATLLGCIHEEFPGVVRLVLSGHTELEAAMRAVPVAHQYLTKPCDSGHLVDTIERACRLRSLLRRDDIKEAVCKANHLPSVPRVYARLRKALADPEMTAHDASEILQEDPAMCAKLLQLANSSFFGRPMKVASVKQAVVHLGINMVSNLVLTAEVFSVYPTDSIAGISIEAAQRYALDSARVARHVLGDVGRDDDLFVAAMLHDIGELVLAAEMPREFEAVLELAGRENIPTIAAEERLLGITHAEVGAHLLALWGLPSRIVEAVAHHHEPMTVERPTMDIPDAIHIADCLLRGQPIDPRLVDALGIKSRIEDWRRFALEPRENGGVEHE